MHLTEANSEINMEHWYNKLAIVTGADQNIGSNVAATLVNKGVIVMGLATDIDQVLKIRSELPTTLRHRLYPLHCDVTNDNQVEQAFRWIQNTYGGIDMLINCAGVLYAEDLMCETSENLKLNLESNIIGIKNCTSRAVQDMHLRMTNGHIVIMNSLLGDISSKLSTYSKDVINELAEMYQNQFVANQIPQIKLTYITCDCGETTPKSTNARTQILNYPMLKTDEISNAVLHTLSKPSLLEINEIIIKPL